jgi:HEAT repeats/PBS lyase HEAT-like repeat
VALKPVDPLCRDAFLADVGRFPSWVVERLSGEAFAGRTGWSDQLHAYRWNGGDWRRGVSDRDDQNQRLSRATTLEEFYGAATAILAWGGIRTGLSHEDAARLRQSLPALDLIRDGGADWESVHARRIASTSKIYAAHEPDQWTIYDSRVAAALANLVAAWWEQTGQESAAASLRFPWPPGRSGNQAPGFPRLGDNSEPQSRLAFIYASWLLRQIAEELTRDREPGPREGWRLPHVEMVLFTLGDSRTAAQLRSHPGSRQPAPRRTTRNAEEPMVTPEQVVAARRAAKAAAATKEFVGKHVSGAARAAIQRRLERRQQLCAALRYAAQINGTIAELQFPDGNERWVVYKDGQPIEEFPHNEGDLEEILVHHENMNLRSPRQIRDSTPLGNTRGRFVRVARGIRDSWQEHSVESLLRQLQSTDLAKRRDAAEKLGERRGSEALGPLVHALRDSNPSVRAAAAVALGKVGDPLASKPLVRLLDDRNAVVRAAAASALGAVQGDEGLDPLINLLSSEDEKPAVKASAAEALGRLGDAAAIQPLAAALRQNTTKRGRSNEQMRTQVAVALGRLGHATATPHLVAALRDSSSMVRKAAARSLAELADKSSMDALEGALQDDDPTVAREVYRALDSIRRTTSTNGQLPAQI